MDQSDDLIKNFIGHLIERGEGLLLLLLLVMLLLLWQLLLLQDRRGWRCQQLVLIGERRGEDGGRKGFLVQKRDGVKLVFRRVELGARIESNTGGHFCLLWMLGNGAGFAVRKGAADKAFVVTFIAWRPVVRGSET